MLSCILIAGAVFFKDGNNLYNMHHATRISFRSSRSVLTADFGIMTMSFDVPDAWAAISTEDVLYTCSEQAEIAATRR
ncbi:hypothetical protein ACOI1H_16310 [Loktanella sp. DJP18]|uniref:hypothetical protein n=1 Tax=Loktanella sp. DJP18 TaxID=3409788 RepID=UPI003BB68033